jgi:hypothetical protein
LPITASVQETLRSFLYRPSPGIPVHSNSAPGWLLYGQLGTLKNSPDEKAIWRSLKSLGDFIANQLKLSVFSINFAGRVQYFDLDN